MTYHAVFSPEAEEQLAALYDYIAVAASPDVAARYTEAIVGYCETFRTFPHRGVERNDIRPGLRITHYRKRTMTAFSVDAGRIAVLGVFYGGQDYEGILVDEVEGGEEL